MTEVASRPAPAVPPSNSRKIQNRQLQGAAGMPPPARTSPAAPANVNAAASGSSAHATVIPWSSPDCNESALNQFRAANYPGAIAGFRGFAKAYPGSSLASNAQYWIGYSYYAMGDYRTALAHQQKLLVAFPQSGKVPDALLNIARCQEELRQTSNARKTLEEIIAKHGDTNAAVIAVKRLATLK